MGYVINKETLEPMTYEQAQAHSKENPHYVDGVGDVVYAALSFTRDGLEGTRYAMLDTGDMPLVDPRYYKTELGDVVNNDGEYSAPWLTFPADRPIEQIAEDKLNDMRAACEAQIIGDGFYSSALGESHKYSSDRDAQSNLTLNLMRASEGVNVDHYCYTSNGERVKAPHSPAQIRQVALDLDGHVEPKRDRCHAKREEIASALAANDKAALIAISWA